MDSHSQPTPLLKQRDTQIDIDKDRLPQRATHNTQDHPCLPPFPSVAGLPAAILTTRRDTCGTQAPQSAQDCATSRCLHGEDDEREWER